MSFDQRLAQRIREILVGTPDLVEKKMFGGIGFLIQGNMACGVNRDNLIVRVGPEKHQEAMSQPHVQPFDLTGKSMSGWVIVNPEGLASEAELDHWIIQGVDYARTLPAK